MVRWKTCLAAVLSCGIAFALSASREGRASARPSQTGSAPASATVDSAMSETAKLQKRIRELEKENARLAHELSVKMDKYGLYWLDCPEAFDAETEDRIPVLEEVTNKEIRNDGGKPTHILIEGDNYHALTCLTFTHRGKIDVIYIDPPYNTGTGDFTYKDKRFLKEFPNGQQIGKDHPLRHSAWLSFMQKRLRLAKALLSERGVIFISIDDNEQANLKLLCDNVFGEKNFVATIPWRKRTAKADVPHNLSQDYEWVLCYANPKFKAGIRKDTRKYYETPDFPGRPWRVHDMTTQRNKDERPNCFFTIVNPKNGKRYNANPKRVWANNEETFKQFYAAGRIVFPGDYDFLKITKPVLRYFKADDERKAGDRFGFTTVSTDLPKEVGMTQDGTKDIDAIFAEKAFLFPKPVSLIEHLVRIATPGESPRATVLDFFAGSGTTMHATMKLNAEDGGMRQCILVQQAEGTNNLCERVTYERNRRVMCGYKRTGGESVPGLGGSLKYYRTAFVGKHGCVDALDEDRDALAANAGTMLALAEGTLDVVPVPKQAEGFWLHYTDGGHKHTLVYYSARAKELPLLAEEADRIRAKDKAARLSVYVYTIGGNVSGYENEFDDLANIELKPIPEPILDIYKSVNGD